MERRKQQHLRALGLARICRVVRQAILLNFANLTLPCLSAALLATALHARVADLDDPSGLLRLVAEWVAFLIQEIAILELLLFCTAAYVLCVASHYRTGGDLLAVHRVLRDGAPVVPFRRLAVTFLLVVLPFFVFFSSPFFLAFFRLEIKIVLPLRLLAWASAAYVAVVGQLVCVVSFLEDAALFSAVRKSLELLAWKLRAAACFTVGLDGCIIAVLKAFRALVLDDALALGVGFQVALGVVMFVALCELLFQALLARTVVYLVCKRDFIDKAHHLQI